jgi:solute:Na+ symporter, SSS family
VFIIFIDPQYAIDLQLIGGVIILQTLPAVAIALYTRWLHRWALVAGWAVGLLWGMVMLYNIPNPATGRAHFGGSALALDKLNILGWQPWAGSTVQIYVGFVALAGNLLVALVVTLIVRRLNVSNGVDETTGEDYHVDEHTENLREIAGSEPTRPAQTTSTSSST